MEAGGTLDDGRPVGIIVIAMSDLIISDLDWNSLIAMVRKQQKNREVFAPAVSAYRWWARRPHSLVGAILDSAARRYGVSMMVSDPFSGGGTVAIEAARRGLEVYAQDLNPWAAHGLGTILRQVDLEELEACARRVIERLVRVGAWLYGDPSGTGGQTIYSLHVRVLECPECGRDNYLFPRGLVSLCQRIERRPTTAWYGCRACGALWLNSWPQGKDECPRCRNLWSAGPSVQARRMVVCAHCGKNIELRERTLCSSRWIRVLELRQGPSGRHWRELCLENLSQLRESTLRGPSLRHRIPAGPESEALRRDGYDHWGQLFSPRQLHSLDAARQAVDEISTSPAVRSRLMLAVVGAAEMASRLTRWDAYYLKPYEALANHHFARTTLAAEVNLLSLLGRGTIPRRIGAAVACAKWLIPRSRCTVRCGSSERQRLRGSSIDLVLTDPPYYADVQYGDLSRLFLAVGHALHVPVPSTPSLAREAVPRDNEDNARRYREVLTRIFSETVRTLKPTGRLILTFRSRKLKAWDALAQALVAAGLVVLGCGAICAENEMDFPKRTRKAVTSDLVIECARRGSTQTGRSGLLAAEPRSEWEKDLAAMGLALCVVTRLGRPEKLGTAYARAVGAFEVRPVIR